MDKFQIAEVTEGFSHAGTKAMADIAIVAERLGYKKAYVRMNTTKDGSLGKIKRQIGYWKDWNKCYKEITENSIVLLQHPFHHKQLTREETLKKLKMKKGVQFISLVHDVEELRAYRYNKYYKREFETMLELTDIFIVHNKVMKQYFIEHGVPENKLVNLHIFDYLQQNIKVGQPTFRKEVYVAGNLDITKCGYIEQLKDLPDIKFFLYGPNFDENLKQYANIVYNGSYPVDEIPAKLNVGFGLVWDGDSIEGCRGLSGQYLRYNNPHKLSLYLASGLPVIIWSNAAEASFVQKHGVGICVDSIADIKDVFAELSSEDYTGLTGAVQKIQIDLVSGKYTEKAMLSVWNKLTNKHYEN